MAAVGAMLLLLLLLLLFPKATRIQALLSLVLTLPRILVIDAVLLLAGGLVGILPGAEAMLGIVAAMLGKVASRVKHLSIST